MPDLRAFVPRLWDGRGGFGTKPECVAESTDSSLTSRSRIEVQIEHGWGAGSPEAELAEEPVGFGDEGFLVADCPDTVRAAFRNYANVLTSFVVGVEPPHPSVG